MDLGKNRKKNNNYYNHPYINLLFSSKGCLFSLKGCEFVPCAVFVLPDFRPWAKAHNTAPMGAVPGAYNAVVLQCQIVRRRACGHHAVEKALEGE